VLNLSGNPIGEEGGMALAEMLRVNKTLLDLDVGGCELGMKSLVSIAAALKVGCCTLKPVLKLESA